MKENFEIITCESNSAIFELYEWYKEFTINNIKYLDLSFFESNRRLYKVQLQNNIIGIGSVYNYLSKFDDFKRFIHPEYRHKKIGDTLLDFIINDAKSLKKSTLMGYYHGKDEAVFNYFANKGFTYTNFDTTATLLVLKF